MKIPIILKIKLINGLSRYCIFNNGETRIFDFKKLIIKWKNAKTDPEYLLPKESEFTKVILRNQTLSWKNIKKALTDINGHKKINTFELIPDLVYENSLPTEVTALKFFFGSIIRDTRIKKGLSQQELVTLCGTTKTYISRIKNNLIESEFSTLCKIVEVGLRKKIKVEIA